MKIIIALTSAALALGLAAPAAAQPRSREFNRGYYDCLAGRFDEEGQNRAYRAGCRAAQRESDEEGPEGGPPPPNYGPPPDRPPPGPGYGGYGGPPQVAPPSYNAPPVGVPNVNGLQPGQVLAAMASRGYRNVGTSVAAGGAVVGLYYNPATHECVQVAHINGRAVYAREIGSDRRCR